MRESSRRIRAVCRGKVGRLVAGDLGPEVEAGSSGLLPSHSYSCDLGPVLSFIHTCVPDSSRMLVQ